MKDVVQSVLQTAKSALDKRREDFQAEEQRLQAEVGIVQHHAMLTERLVLARERLQVVKLRLNEMTEPDFIPCIAQQILDDLQKLSPLLSQLVVFDAARAHKAEILVAVERCTVEEAKSNLAAFEREHGAILKKYLAIS